MMIGAGLKAKQLMSLSYAQQLWDEWELQCMVLFSFTLQAFFLFAAGIRKRNKSTVLRILLWLAYLSADYVAVFVLGHLTLQLDDPRHQLVLLWAPVLLLHLGGQETITAFAMEDNQLWKRHLLGLVTQVALAVYVVAKSWRNDNQGLLVAPVALMFLSGTVKYAERTWALKMATPETVKGSRMGDLYKTMWVYQYNQENSLEDIKRYNDDIAGRSEWWLQEEYADLVEAAGYSFPNCINALMDIPVAPWLLPRIWDMIEKIACRHRPKKDGFPSRAFKMGEIQLSLMYDHLYTKVGLRHAQCRPVIIFGLPVLTLVTTSSALVLFAMTRKDGVYNIVDVAISYVLLAGAVMLEAISILTFTLSLRSYCFLREKLGGSNRFTHVIFYLVKSMRPYGKPLWSNKWGQYNLLTGCIREKQAGFVTRMMRYVGLVRDTKLCTISDEMKELICNELDDWSRVERFSHVRGQGILSQWGLAEDSDLYKSIDRLDFPTSVVVWHLITDICFLHAKTGDNDSQHMLLAREVSNYIMDLLMVRRVMISSEGHVAHRKARDEVGEILKKRKQIIDINDKDAIKKMLEAGVSDDPATGGESQDVFARNACDTIRPVLPRAWRLAQMLLHGWDQEETGGGGVDMWEVIASVWIEMLFHLATRCEAGFHAKNLCTGGEFITHVRFLLLNRGIGWNYVLSRA